MPSINSCPDAISDVLSLVRMRGEMVCVNEYSAPWSYSFGKPIAHFHIVERGVAWLMVKGHDAIRVEPGDLVVLPLGTGHSLASSPSRKPIPIDRAVAESGIQDGTVCRLGGGGEQTHMVCGQFSFEGFLAPRLVSVLPPLIHIRAAQGRPLEWLQLTSHFMIVETRSRSPGSAVMISRLLDLLFIQAIREWGGTSQRNMGWLSGLRDQQIGRVLSALHDRPAHDWTVGALAQLAGLSRSAFASRFAEVVGETPLRYLASWRLNLAAEHLRTNQSKVGTIAALVGYGSEAALTRAFKSHFQTTPGAFRSLKITRSSGM